MIPTGASSTASQSPRRDGHRAVFQSGLAGLLLTSILLATATPAQNLPTLIADRLAGSTVVNYQVRSNKFPYQLQGELRWVRNGLRYRAELSYSLLGQKRGQSSQGLIGDQGLLPERFVDHKGKDQIVQFDLAKRSATLANGQALGLQPGAQDRLSVLLNLGALVASNTQGPHAQHQLTTQTVGAAGASAWTWVLVGSERLDLPGGSLQTQKWSRQVGSDSKHGLDVWFAPALGYLPARIKIIEENGDQIDQQWQGHAPIPDS